MKTQTKSVHAPKNAVRDDLRKNNPRLRTIHDPWIYSARVVHSKSTR